MWIRYGKPDASMTRNGLLAGLVAITAPSGFVNPMPRRIIGLVAGVLVCVSCEFVERVLKVDDPVGAISVHGTNGIWGVIAVGLFADGKSNYGGSWNGVAGNVTGLFYGDAGQLVAQLMGVATLIGFVFVLSFLFNTLRRLVRRSARLGEDRTGRPGHSGNGRARAIRTSSSSRNPKWRVRLQMTTSSTALVSTTSPTAWHRQAAASLPPVPWRDPHTVAPGELTAYIRHLEQACLDEPAVGRSANVPRHGPRRQLRRRQVDGGARRRAVASIRTTSGRS